MKATQKAHNLYAGERTETLMLLAVFADEPQRLRALAELNTRREMDIAEALPVLYTTNLGVIAC